MFVHFMRMLCVINNMLAAAMSTSSNFELLNSCRQYGIRHLCVMLCYIQLYFAFMCVSSFVYYLVLVGILMPNIVFFC